MIIDFHTHVFPASFREKREQYVERDSTFAALFSHPDSKISTAEELVAAMDVADVDLAVVMGIGWWDRGAAAEANDYIMQSTEIFPSRLVGFCSVNPAWGQDAVKEVERCAAHGIKGIGELHPDTQGYDLGDIDVMAPIMEVARELGLVLLTHSSEPVGHLYPGKGQTTPEVLYRFVQNFPDAAIVCAHWGGGLPFYSLMPEVAEATQNIYYDTAASPFLYGPGIIPPVSELCGPGRVLFGTDFPLISHRRMMKQIEEAPLGPEDIASILGGNARGLLGI